MVRRFREFDENYNFVGPWMVAKQSRFIDDENTKDQKRFHQSFCSTQQIAERIAQKFNERLATIPGVTSATPRIKFLDCHVYVLDDELLGVTGVLVENKLDTKKLKWKKWKNNNGYVTGMKHHLAAFQDTPLFRVNQPWTARLVSTRSARGRAGSSRLRTLLSPWVPSWRMTRKKRATRNS